MRNPVNERLSKAGLNNSEIKTYNRYISQVNIEEYNSIKSVLNVYFHPPIQEVDDYKNDPTKKTSTLIDFADIDDLTYLTIINYKLNMSLQEFFQKSNKYLDLIRKYELRERKHVHKGAIYYNMGLAYLSVDINDLAL